MIAALILIPMLAGCATLVLRPSDRSRLALLGAALAHFALTVAVWLRPPQPILRGWLALDTAGLLFLSITSVLFLASAIYCMGYLREESSKRHVDTVEGFLFSNEPQSVFCGCMLLFLASMTLVTLSQHFGLLWVGVEATTLASAPLIYFHRHHRSLEATWKYLLICSVGIALALLGNFVLAVAASQHTAKSALLLAPDLLAHARELNVPWLKAAFLFFLVGYGTKMGLAPLHTWLPDAHSESPSAVSALLSGALLNCAFLGILRAHRLCVAAGEGAFSEHLLVVFGLLSMGLAAVFILRQSDFKRMLAYSSVEHMGILAVGFGLGGAGAFGSLLHAFNHSLTKAALFLLAGNILAAYGTKSIKEVRGVVRMLPVTGVLWVAGFFAITGAPPFGAFMSKFTVLKAALDGEHVVVAVLFLVLLALVFIGMANIVLQMAYGSVSGDLPRPQGKECFWTICSPAALTALTLCLGLFVPSWLNAPLQRAAEEFQGGAGTAAIATIDGAPPPPTAAPTNEAAAPIAASPSAPPALVAKGL